jgi:hypothetical protein
MTTDYAPDAASALQQIEEAGRVVTLRRMVLSGSVNVVADTPATPTPQNADVKLVAFPLRGRSSDTFEQQLQIREKYRKFLMAAVGLSFVPETGMSIIGWEGTNWNISACTPLSPDGSQVIIYYGTMQK